MIRFLQYLVSFITRERGINIRCEDLQWALCEALRYLVWQLGYLFFRSYMLQCNYLHERLDFFSCLPARTRKDNDSVWSTWMVDECNRWRYTCSQRFQRGCGDSERVCRQLTQNLQPKQNAIQMARRTLEIKSTRSAAFFIPNDAMSCGETMPRKLTNAWASCAYICESWVLGSLFKDARSCHVSTGWRENNQKEWRHTRFHRINLLYLWTVSIFLNEKWATYPNAIWTKLLFSPRHST